MIINISKYLGKTLFLLPILIMLSFFLKIHSIPNNDYWASIIGIMDSMISKDLTQILLSFFVRSNEHLIVIPNILFISNVLVFNGSNKGLFFIAFFIVLMELFVLFRLINETSGVSKTDKTIIMSIASVFLFSPAAAHNWITSFSGVVWFLSNLLAVLAIYFFFRSWKTDDFKFVLLCILTTILGMLTYSTSVFVFMPIVFFSLLQCLRDKNKSKNTLIYTVSSIFYYFVFAINFERAPHHPDFIYTPFDILRYLFAYLGGIYSTKVNHAMIFGVFGFSAFFFVFIRFCLYLFNNKNIDYILPWVMISTHAFLNGIFTAIARYQFGVDSALVSRYGNIQLMFWMGTTVSFFLIMTKNGQATKFSKAKKLLFGGILSFLIVMMSIKGAHSSRSYFNKFSNKAIQKSMEYSFKNGIFDNEMIKSRITMHDKYFIDNIHILRKFRHVPFVKEIHYSKAVETVKGLPKRSVWIVPGSVGYFSPIHDLGNGAFRVYGWFYDQKDTLEYILLTDSTGNVLGMGFPGGFRPDVWRYMTKNLSSKFPDISYEKAAYSGWIGYLQSDDLRMKIHCYAKLRKKPYLVELNAHFLTDKN